MVLLQYRVFGSLNWKVSALGFGTLRLPIIGDDISKVDEAKTIEMIRYAVDHGVNYVDTAFVYNDGGSEIAVGKALSGEYRGKAKIATKMPVLLVVTKSDLDRFFSLQLSRLNTNYIDFYLLHGLTKELWDKTESMNILTWAETQIVKGRIGYLGFSFHDSIDVFKEIVDGYDKWDFCQIQYNYIDENYQAGKQGLKYAAEKGLAVSVMEPLAAGTLAVNPPIEIQKIWNSSGIQRSAAEWALSWVWNQPEVAVALSGMSSIEQVKENIEAADKSSPNMMSSTELELVSKAAKLYSSLGFIGCTKCRYCAHCPVNVAIPEVLAVLNEFTARRRSTEMQAEIKQKYTLIPPSRRASNCIKCGQCETACPQHLPVRRLLAEATSTFEK